MIDSFYAGVAKNRSKLAPALILIKISIKIENYRKSPKNVHICSFIINYLNYEKNMKSGKNIVLRAFYSFLSYYRGKKPMEFRYVQGKVQVSFYFYSSEVVGSQNNTIYRSFDRINTNFWSDLDHRTMKIDIILRIDHLPSALRTAFFILFIFFP